jgi:hypothetical protein
LRHAQLIGQRLCSTQPRAGFTVTRLLLQPLLQVGRGRVQ